VDFSSACIVAEVEFTPKICGRKSTAPAERAGSGGCALPEPPLGLLLRALPQCFERQAFDTHVINAPGDSVRPDHEVHIPLMGDDLHMIETTETEPAHGKPESDERGMVPAHGLVRLAAEERL